MARHLSRTAGVSVLFFKPSPTEEKNFQKDVEVAGWGSSLRNRNESWQERFSIDLSKNEEVFLQRCR